MRSSRGTIDGVASRCLLRKFAASAVERRRSQDRHSFVNRAQRPLGRRSAIEKLDAIDRRFMLGKRRGEIARRRTALNLVIGHHHMHDVLRAPRRHVAAHAIVRRRVPRVAAEADGDDAGEPRIFLQRLMRIVAGAAGDPALDVAKALAQSIRVMVDLESLLARTSRLVDVDVQHVIRKRLAGTKRKVAALETPRTDHRHRRLQMTLKTDGIAQRRRAAAPD